MMLSMRLVVWHGFAVSNSRGVRRLEGLVAGQDQKGLGSWLVEGAISLELLRAAVVVKRAASQIDNIVHAVGIVKRAASQIDNIVHAVGMLLCLPGVQNLLSRAGNLFKATALSA
jgi:hypothetical protein